MSYHLIDALATVTIRVDGSVPVADALAAVRAAQGVELSAELAPHAVVSELSVGAHITRPLYLVDTADGHAADTAERHPATLGDQAFDSVTLADMVADADARAAHAVAVARRAANGSDATGTEDEIEALHAALQAAREALSLALLVWPNLAANRPHIADD